MLCLYYFLINISDKLIFIATDKTFYKSRFHFLNIPYFRYLLDFLFFDLIYDRKPTFERSIVIFFQLAVKHQ